MSEHQKDTLSFMTFPLGLMVIGFGLIWVSLGEKTYAFLQGNLFLIAIGLVFFVFFGIALCEEERKVFSKITKLVSDTNIKWPSNRRAVLSISIIFNAAGLLFVLFSYFFRNTPLIIHPTQAFMIFSSGLGFSVTVGMGFLCAFFTERSNGSSS
jgi:hypothetical protein